MAAYHLNGSSTVTTHQAYVHTVTPVPAARRKMVPRRQYAVQRRFRVSPIFHITRETKQRDDRYQHFFCASTMAAGRFGCYSGYSTITMSDVTGLGDWTDNVWPTYYDYNATIRAFSVEIHNQVITTTSDPIHTSLSILMTDSSTTTLSTQAESNSSSTLSGGAIAGIVVGVVGALALGAIGAFLLMRRRRQGDPSPPSSPTPSSDFPVQQVSLQRSMTMRHELEEQRYPSEMPQWNDRTNQEVHKPTAWELPA
ncbi:hypothetical protein AAE478_002537 [Parahypoxylon ruwenzoriense]